MVAGELDDARLRDLIDEAEAACAELLFVHLSRHLSTRPLLTAEQIARYRVLRGYAPDEHRAVKLCPLKAGGLTETGRRWLTMRGATATMSPTCPTWACLT